MKLREPLTGFLMFAVIMGVVLLSQEVFAGGQCSQACGGDTNPPPPDVKVLTANSDDGGSLKRFWATYRKPISWIGVIGLSLTYTPKSRNAVAEGRSQVEVEIGKGTR